MKIGTMVETVRACGALAEKSALDLHTAVKGKLLGVRGEHAKIQLDAASCATHGISEGTIVYLATEYLKQ